MPFKDYLQSSLLGNPVENYLWAAGIILLALVFKRLISKKLGQVVFKVFKRKEGNGLLNVDQFFDLMIKPVEVLIVLVGLTFALNMLHFLNKTVHFRLPRGHLGPQGNNHQ